MQETLRDSKEIPVVKAAVRWAQSLEYIYLEVGMKHRHDGVACRNITDDKIYINTKEFHFTATCHMEGQSVRYVADLNLWGEGVMEAFTNADPNYDMKRYNLANGLARMRFQKLNQPNRWRHLQDVSVPASESSNIKVDMFILQKFAKELLEFSGDEVSDFDGLEDLQDMEEEEKKK